MESRVKLFGHPIHPMLIVFPLGLLGIAVLFDVLYLITGNEFFPVVSYWNIVAGLISGLVAAVFGLLDWLNIPGGTRAKAIGLWHGLGNVVIIVLFALAWFLRRDAPNFAPGTVALVLELLGVGLAVLTGWLGGELVYRLRVGVDKGAHLDAPSSLSGEPAERRVE
jgi:uncharacterized membrane protein